jgi:hypothetical protein
VNVGSNISDSISVIYTAGNFICPQTQDTYQWGFDNKDSLYPVYLYFEINPNYYNPTPNFASNLYWVMTTHNGCSQKAYYNLPTKISDLTEGTADALKIYPNPSSSGSVTIELPVLAEKVSFIITDVLGNTIMVKDYATNSATKLLVDLKGAAKGIYFIKAVTDSKTYTGRVVLQ